MADYFYDGMPNVNERLNLLYTAFAAGPYNALPLTGGTLTGPVSSNSRISTTADVVASSGILLGNPGEDGISSFRSPMFGASTAGIAQDVLSLGVAGIPGQAFPGRFVWDTSSGNGSLYAAGYTLRLKSYDAGTTSSTTVLVINGSGGITSAGMIVAPVCQFGPIPRTGNECVIAGAAQSQGQPNVRIPNSATFFVTAGASGSSAPCALNVGADTTSGRGINVGGTINASGADYAEYLTKGLLCGTIFPGQIVGIDADGRLTDKWDRAVTFVSKSTNPCMVGGDTWAQELGARPSAPVRVMPVTEKELVSPAVPADEASGTPAVAAVYCSIVVTMGDTDTAWAAKEAAYATEVQAFDASLEALRQTVDRIAFAGQVPVNIFGATPGQYIVPVQDGDGIAGMAMDEDDMTLKQYMRSIGKVIAIEGDGRARIIVKVA